MSFLGRRGRRGRGQVGSLAFTLWVATYQLVDEEPFADILVGKDLHGIENELIDPRTVAIFP